MNFVENKATIIQKDLKKKNITSVDTLFEEIKKGDLFRKASLNMQQLFLEFLREELSKNSGNLPILSTSEVVGKYLANKYSVLKQEELHLISVNNRYKPTADFLINIGKKNASQVDIGEVIKRTVLSNASGVFLAHNHPSGDLTPSHADMEVCNLLMSIFDKINVTFLDNLIIGEGEYFSFREKGLFIADEN
ncbi:MULTISPECIES: JAB domain-containing protein [Lactobacillus]|uniref:MPN domain-containing protein n=1 Tax=Lactobacillus melliventris TaxID=1218507 RepID=A0A0F4L913_9LACO|nr:MULTISPECIES: JAB domain-containing protein [Lactobacillus]KJY54759.1 hypothetical protein JF74_19410 [Lactobacillus melliventris]UZX32427.1 JAB domain-containing protein [Lactobacillus helsingborgensis]